MKPQHLGGADIF